MVQMQYLSDIQVKGLLEFKWHKIIEVIEKSFNDPTSCSIPKTYLNASVHGDYRAMPAALGKFAGIKWIGVFPDNETLPTTIGTFILNDRNSGLPLLSMDCTTLTAYRTAATSAIAAKYCAPEAKEFAFIGCGLQARYHIEAYEAVYGHMNMYLETYDKDGDQMKELHNWVGNESLAKGWGHNKSVEAAVQHADVITTLTPSTEPYLDISDVKSDCHINAVGADAVGKRELMTNVIDGSANIVCDDWEQASHSGELQYNEWPNLSAITMADLIKCNDSQKLSKGVSVFDSTGIATEDIAIAILIYNLWFDELTKESNEE